MFDFDGIFSVVAGLAALVVGIAWGVSLAVMGHWEFAILPVILCPMVTVAGIKIFIDPKA